MSFFSTIKSHFIKTGLLSIILLILLLVPKQTNAKLVYLYDYSAKVSGGTPTHIYSDPDGVLYTYSPVGGSVASNPKYLMRFPDRTTVESINWTQLDSNDYTDMVVTRNIIFALNSSQWVTRITLNGLSGSVSTGCRTTLGSSSIAMSPSGNLYVARGSQWFGQVDPNTLPPSLIVSFNSGLAVSSAGLSPVPASKGCAVGSNGVVYYLRTSPRNAVYFRTITGTGTSSSFTLPGSWGSSPLGGKLIRVSPGGALYIPAATTATTVQSIFKMMPVANGNTVSYIASYNVNTGTSGNISKMVSMALLPNGQVAVLTISGNIQIYAPLPSVSNVSAVPSDNRIYLSWTSNITDTDFSGATIRRSTSGYPTSVTDGIAVTSNLTSASSFYDANVLDGVTYYYRIFNQTKDNYYDEGVTVSATAVFLDTTAPDTPSITATKPILSGNSIVIERSTSSGATRYLLQYQFNEGPIFTVSSNMMATSFTHSDLLDGTYVYSVYAIDEYQNMSNAGISTILTIDTEAPLAPEIEAVKPVLNGAQINLAWNVPAGTSKFLLERSFNSGSFITVSSNISAFVNSFSQTGLEDGTYTYQLYAIDAYTNTSNAGIVAALHIDTTAPSTPEVTITKLAPNSATVNVTWTRPEGTESFNYRDKVGSLETGLDGISASQNDYLNAPFSEGIHTISVVAIDAYGNKSATGSAEVVIDTTAPSQPEITATKPILSGNSIVIERSTSSGATRYLLLCQFNEGPLFMVSSNMMATSFTHSGLLDGTYTYQLYAIDAYTNTSNAGIVAALHIDTTAPSTPEVTITKLAMNSATVNVTWTRPEGTESFNYRDKVGSLETGLDQISASQNDYLNAPFSEGIHTISVVAIDAYGNKSATGSAEVVIDTTAPSQPEITATKPRLNGNTIFLEWTVPSTTSTFILKRIWNNSSETIVSSNIPATVTSLTQNTLSDGTYVYRLYAVDAYTNTSNAGTSIQLTIDSTVPTKPGSFTITPDETTALLSWTKSSDTASVTLRKSTTQFPISITDGTAVLTDSEATSYTLTGLEEGTYYVAIFAKDAYGNSSLATTASMVIDTKPTIEKLITRGEIEKGEINITTNITTPIVATEIGKNAKQATLNIAATYNTDGTSLGVGIGSVGHIVLDTPNAIWRDIGNVNIGVNGGQGIVKQSSGSVMVSGKLQLASGSLYFLSGGTLKTQVFEIAANEGPDAFTWTGGTMETQGVIGNLNNNGGTLIVKSDNPLRITGNYTQGGTGQLAISLKAINLGLAHSTDSLSNVAALIQTTEGISLSGTIKITLDGYAALPGDKILIVKRGESSLRLNALQPQSEDVTFDLPTLESRLSWDTTSFETDGYIRVMASSSGLLADRPLNYPNPFKLSTGTDIGYYLNQDADIDLRVYTANGSEVYRVMLVSGVNNGAKAGYNKVHIGRENLDKDLPSGVYPYMLLNNGKVVGQGRLVVRP